MAHESQFPGRRVTAISFVRTDDSLLRGFLMSCCIARDDLNRKCTRGFKNKTAKQQTTATGIKSLLRKTRGARSQWQGLRPEGYREGRSGCPGRQLSLLLRTFAENPGARRPSARSCDCNLGCLFYRRGQDDLGPLSLMKGFPGQLSTTISNPTSLLGNEGTGQGVWAGRCLPPHSAPQRQGHWYLHRHEMSSL